MAGVQNWKVDIQEPKKNLKITTDNVSESNNMDAVEKMGYKAGVFV